MSIPEYTPWVEHLYSALRWMDRASKRMHGLVERERVDDGLRDEMLSLLSTIEGARRQAFFAFEKMGEFGSGKEQVKIDLSSIGDETKIQMLKLNAELLEQTLNEVKGKDTVESLRGRVLSIVAAMKEKAQQMEAKRKKDLEGPKGGDGKVL